MKKIDAVTVTSNIMWRFLERCGAQLVTTCVGILLARLLMPEAYGTVAIVFAMIAFLQVFVDSGLANALVQKKDVDDLDYSTVFLFNIGSCLVMYLALFLAAGPIATFYGIPELKPLTRVLGLNLIITGIKNVQQAYVSRNMIFKKFFFATLGGTILAAVVGVAMALKGYGVWALVAQYLVNATCDTVILWFTVEWRPHWKFSFARLRRLFAYGWKLLASALLDTGYTELRSLIIGKVYSSADLGHYTKGKEIPNLITANISTAINSVLFPAMSEAQDDIVLMKQFTRRSIKTSSYIMWPMMFGLIACSEPLVRVVLTEKWMESVPFMQLMCLQLGFYPVHVANLQAIKALGRSDLFLKLEIIKKVYVLALLILALQHSVMAVAVVGVISTLISTVVNSFPNWKLLKYSYWEQVKDMAPPFLLSAAMAFIVYQISHLVGNDILLLLIQVPVGVAIYVAGSWVFRMESFHYLLNFAGRILSKRLAGRNQTTEK